MLWPDVEGPNHPVELIALGLHTAVTHVRGEVSDWPVAASVALACSMQNRSFLAAGG